MYQPEFQNKSPTHYFENIFDEKTFWILLTPIQYFNDKLNHIIKSANDQTRKQVAKQVYLFHAHCVFALRALI